MREGVLRVGVEPGAGLVGRFGDVVVLVAPEAVADGGGPVDGLVELVETAVSEAAAPEAGPPGEVVAARLAGWLGARLPADGTAFGVVAPVAGGLVVLLRGAVWAEVTAAGTTERISGDRALTWADRVIPLPVERVAVGAVADRPVRVHPRSELHGGVVPAQGFVLLAGTGPAAAPADPVRSGTVAVGGPDARRPERPVPPRARADPAAAGRPEAETGPGSQSGPPEQSGGGPGPDEVRPPDGRAAVATGPRQSAPAGETLMAAAPVGVLACADGPTILLDRAYVLGREPHNDPAVQKGTASPVILRDPEKLLSRVHAHVWVEEGSVHVCDAASVSGTYVAAPGNEDWTRVGTEPTRLHPNWSMRIGKLVFAFHPAGSAAAG